MQTHARTAAMKERKEQRTISFEDVPDVRHAQRILTELTDENAAPLPAAVGLRDEEEED